MVELLVQNWNQLLPYFKKINYVFVENSKFNSERVLVLVSQPIKGLTPAFSVSNLITHLSDLPRPDCMEFFVGI